MILGLVSLLSSTPLKNQVHLLILKKVKGGGGALPKRETNLELIFLGQGPKIYKAKTMSWTKVT